MFQNAPKMVQINNTVVKSSGQSAGTAADPNASVLQSANTLGEGEELAIAWPNWLGPLLFSPSKQQLVRDAASLSTSGASAREFGPRGIPAPCLNYH